MRTGCWRPGTDKAAAPGKYRRNMAVSSVADMMITLKSSGLFTKSPFSNPNRMSECKVRSWASSMMITEYRFSRGSSMASRSKIPCFRPHRAPQNTKHKTKNTQHKTQNTNHKPQNTKHKTQNTKHKHDSCWSKGCCQQLALQNVRVVHNQSPTRIATAAIAAVCCWYWRECQVLGWWLMDDCRRCSRQQGKEGGCFDRSMCQKGIPTFCLSVPVCFVCCEFWY